MGGKHSSVLAEEGGLVSKIILQLQVSTAPTSVSCLVVQGLALILLLPLRTFDAETTNFASQKPLYI